MLIVLSKISLFRDFAGHNIKMKWFNVDGHLAKSKNETVGSIRYLAELFKV